MAKLPEGWTVTQMSRPSVEVPCDCPVRCTWRHFTPGPTVEMLVTAPAPVVIDTTATVADDWSDMPSTPLSTYHMWEG